MGIKKILGGKVLKSKKCFKCGFKAKLEEGKSIDELARLSQKDPRLSISDMSHVMMGGTKGRKKRRKRIFTASEIARLADGTVVVFYDEAQYQEMENCPHCEVSLEDAPEEK